MYSILRMLAIGLLPSIALAADNSPPAGDSLFDRLMADDAGANHEIPFPFPRLLASLQSRLGYSSDEDVLAKILIPRGRSLHREAARPDYYKYPRVVIALDREGHGSELVKNRLFLGYQERAESIEVISYNERAGRFEFQVVENYAAGKTPRVSYASRSLCTGCHQNEAPIFPRPLWQETSFNREVAASIREYHEQYQGIDIEQALADRIDFATDQASLLSAYQMVWQRGCPDDHCRAKLFLASLLRKLDDETAAYQWSSLELDLLKILEKSWAQTWPKGLPVAGADINDRSSHAGDDPLGPEYSPATPRPPAAYWSARTATIRTLEGIADQFLPVEKLQQLSNSSSIDNHEIEAALRQLHSSTDQAALFAAGPIPGARLMQELIAQIDSRE